MKKMGKVLLSVLGVVYLGVIVFATVCLLFYNQYKVTQINDKTFILIDSKSDKYTDGDLVIFTKNPNNEIKKGDEIFFYEVSQGKVSVNTGIVSNSEVIDEDETTFTINDNHKISSESVIGKTLTANVYPKVGKILYVIESRFGFLLFVILPALLFFFYEIYRLVMEIKTPVEEDEEETQLKEVVVSKLDTAINNDLNTDNDSLSNLNPTASLNNEDNLNAESNLNPTAESANLNSEMNMDNNSTPSVNPTLNNVDNSFSIEEVNDFKKEEKVNNVETLSMNLESENILNEKPIDNKSDSFSDSKDDSSDDVESLF